MFSFARRKHFYHQQTPENISLEQQACAQGFYLQNVNLINKSIHAIVSYLKTRYLGSSVTVKQSFSRKTAQV